jgi:exonuclease SbcC
MNENDIMINFGLSNITRKVYLESEYYICNKENCSLKYSNFAKYIIFPIAENNKSQLEWSKFSLLQQTIVSPLYFQNRNDLHWNIYLVFLLEDHLIVTPKDKYLIENDENYARKHVLTMTESKLLFEQQYLFANINSDNIQANNFIEDWSSALTKAELSGCMYNAFSQDLISKYLEDGISIRPVGRPSNYTLDYRPRDFYTVNKVNSVSTTDYRSFCLGEKLTIEPGRVNLFSGSNGSGKTSICEAIEYALTGEIRRNANFTEPGSVKLEVENSHSEMVLYSSKLDTKKKKELDYGWYGTISTSLSRKSELNSNFSIFNHLDSKSTLDLFDSDTKDLQKTIKNMVIGEDVIECEKNIEKFNIEFFAAGKKIKREIDQLGNEITQLEDGLSKSQNTDFDYNREFIGTDINSLYSEIIGSKIFNNVTEQYTELAQVSSDVDFLEKYVNSKMQDVSPEKLLSQKDLLIADQINFNLMISNNYESIARRESLLCKVSEIDQSIKLLKDTSQLLEDFRNRNSELLLRVKAIGYPSLQTFFEDYLKKNYEHQILNQIIPSELSEHIEMLDSFDLKSQDILMAKKEEYSILQNKYEELHSQYSEEEKNEELKSVLISQLIDLVSGESERFCPLCGVNHNTSEQLKISMANTAKTLKTNQKLKRLKIDFESTSFELEKRKEQIQNVTEQEKTTTFLLDIYNHLINSNIAIEGNDAEVITIRKSIKLHDTIINFLNSTENLFHQIDNLMHDNIYNDASEAQQSDMQDYCNLEIQKQNMSIQELESEKNAKIQDINEIPNDLLQLNNNVFEKIKDNQNMLESLNSILSNISSIENVFGTFYNQMSCNEWIRKYKNTFSVIEKLKVHEDMFRANSSISIIKQEKLDQLAKLKIHQTRCQTAIGAISSLSKSDDYLKDFLKQNAQKIERIFESIHRPKEFSDLAIDNGKVTFIRSSESERIVSNQMSTGQSVALAISLLLSLYTSSCNAPKVLIFDEPIANMDDLHMMNFIDILREAAISGTQIFVTTANDSVAGLFRRKFSFFGNEFKHFYFERGDSTPAVIKQIEYDPYKESYTEEILNAKQVI